MLYLTCSASVFYAGTICIPANMISIPAGKKVENEKSIYNTNFFYLHAIFNLLHQFLYMSMSCIPMGKMYGINYNESRKIKINLLYQILFICMLYLTGSSIFICRHNLYMHRYDLYTCQNVYQQVRCRPDLYLFSYLQAWSVYPQPQVHMIGNQPDAHENQQPHIFSLCMIYNDVPMGMFSVHMHTSGDAFFIHGKHFLWQPLFWTAVIWSLHCGDWKITISLCAIIKAGAIAEALIEIFTSL